VILVFPGCIEKAEKPVRINPTRYFPLNTGDEFIYSGQVRKAVTINNIENLYTRAYIDSTGDLIRWEDFIKTDNTIKLKSRLKVAPSMPAIHFEPPIPYVPWTSLVGDTLLFNTVEIRNDSINSHLRVQLRYEIEAVETVSTASGNFNDCIKMRILYRTLDDTETRFMDGESLIWYARNIGVVKYITPDGRGDLLQASVAGQTVP
jgi:hypothetical protein